MRGLPEPIGPCAWAHQEAQQFPPSTCVKAATVTLDDVLRFEFAAREAAVTGRSIHSRCVATRTLCCRHCVRVGIRDCRRRGGTGGCLAVSVWLLPFLNPAPRAGPQPDLDHVDNRAQPGRPADRRRARPVPITRGDHPGKRHGPRRALQRTAGSPSYPTDETELRDRVQAFDRGFNPQGVARQLAAAMTTPDRTERPAPARPADSVIHGAEDPVIALSGGQATAEAIRGAELVVIDGMGHDLPRQLWPAVAERIAALVAARSSDQDPQAPR